jgi:hypothetical protein
MNPRRPRLLQMEAFLRPKKKRPEPVRVRKERPRPASLAMTASAFDFNEPIELQIGRADEPRSFSEASPAPEPVAQAPAPARREPTPVRPSEPAVPDAADDEAAREDLAAVAATPAPAAPAPGLVRAHEVFDRLAQGEPPPPPKEEEPEAGAPRASGRGHDVFDRMDLSRAATFDAGEFAVEQALDKFDRILSAKPPAPAPLPERAEEVDAVEDVAAIVDTLKAAQGAPQAPEPRAESLTASGARFVTDVDSHGWLRIKWEDGTTYPDVLPFQLKVDVTKIEAGREHFTVKEGLLKGKKGSVKLKAADGDSFLSKTGDHKGPASLELDLAAATITIKDVGTFSAELDASNPIPKGTYDLEIPFEIHHLADAYLKDSPFATTWFRIGHTGDRFLHPGSVSAGCATVLDHKEWTRIYNHLVRSRKDDQSAGTLVVK